MKRSDFRNDAPGRLVKIKLNKRIVRRDGVPELRPVPALAFVPHDLPPPLDWRQIRSTLFEKLENCAEALGRVNGLNSLLHNRAVLLHSLWLREAKLSSAVENINTTAIDMVLAATSDARPQSASAIEAANAVKALEVGLASALPFSARLMLEMHRNLLEGVRGEDKRPGEFRDIPVYIGADNQPENARFVPPPPGSLPGQLLSCISALEQFVNRVPAEIPRVIAVALSHYQFETIHPFRDGNGRLGRALAIHQMCRCGLLDHSVLFLSGYFSEHRKEYVDRLLAVSMQGAWNEWIGFFLDAVVVQAARTIRLVEKIVQLREAQHHEVQGRGLPTRLLHLIDELFRWPVVSARRVSEMLAITDPTARKDIAMLEELGMLKPVSELSYAKVWFAPGVISVIEGEGEDA